MITSTRLIAYFQRAVAGKWGYVWGLNGELYTRQLAEKYHAAKRKTSSSRNPATYWLKDCARWIGKMAADCSGGIVGAFRSVHPTYSDRTANTFYNQCTEKGPISTIPEIPGLCVWRSGHIGIYEGNGNVLEFRGTEYGAVRTRLKDRNFTNWGRLRDVDYGVPAKWTVSRVLKLHTPRMKGDDIRELQQRIYDSGVKVVLVNGKGTPLDVDGVFGTVTNAAVKMYQKSMGITVDGKAGKNTITKLGGTWRA